MWPRNLSLASQTASQVKGGGQLWGGGIAISGTAGQISLIFSIQTNMVKLNWHVKIHNPQLDLLDFRRFLHYHGNRFGIRPSSQFQCSFRPKTHHAAKFCRDQTSRSWDPASLTLEDYYNRWSCRNSSEYSKTWGNFLPLLIIRLAQKIVWDIFTIISSDAALPIFNLGSAH